MNVDGCPVLLGDVFGVVIRDDESSETVGVQVPGEDDIRWLKRSGLVDAGSGALIYGEAYAYHVIHREPPA